MGDIFRDVSNGKEIEFNFHIDAYGVLTDDKLQVMAAGCTFPEQEWEMNPFCLYGIRKQHLKKEKVNLKQSWVVLSLFGMARTGFCPHHSLVCRG